MNKKTIVIIGWILCIIVVCIYVASGVSKLFPSEEAIKRAQGVSGINNMYILGFAETAIAFLFLIPRTGILGTLLAIAYMGGAMAIHLANGMPLMIPTLIQILIWVAAAFRFPELLQRVVNKKINFKNENN